MKLRDILWEIEMGSSAPYATSFKWYALGELYEAHVTAEGVDMEFIFIGGSRDASNSYSFAFSMPDARRPGRQTTTNRDSTAVGKLSYIRVLRTAMEALIDFIRYKRPEILDLSGADADLEKSFQKTNIYKKLLDQNVARLNQLGYAHEHDDTLDKLIIYKKSFNTHDKIEENHLIRMIKLNNILMEVNEEEKNQYVIFVSGIETSMTHQGQVNIFKEGFRTKYLIKSYKYTEIDLVNDFISKNSIAAVVLFSAGAGNANKIKGLSSSKIYCIEPWNDSSNSRGSRFEFIPASNMYIDNQSYARGKGIKQGANFTDHDAGHFEALKTSAKSISNSL